jgi:hypothetical protein
MLPVVTHIGVQGLAGYLIPTFMLVCGVMLWFSPIAWIYHSLLAILLALGSWITSNFGGFFVGMLIGVVGGALAFAWTTDAEYASPGWLRGKPRIVLPSRWLDLLSRLKGLSPWRSEDHGGPTESPGAAEPCAEQSPIAEDNRLSWASTLRLPPTLHRTVRSCAAVSRATAARVSASARKIMASARLILPSVPWNLPAALHDGIRARAEHRRPTEHRRDFMTVIRPSRLQRDGLFGGLLLVLVLAFARGFPGATTTGGRIAVAAFTGGMAVLVLWGWIRLIRRPSHLEISPEAVTLVEPGGRRTTLPRASGDKITVAALGGGRYRRSALTISGSGTMLPLSFFSLAEIQRQCLACGWQFHKPGRRRNEARGAG